MIPPIYYVKRSLALLLLLSVFNFIASPFSLMGSGTNVRAVPLSPFDGPTEFIRQIPLTTNDLVYSASTGKLYATVPSSVGAGGNSIKAIDPTTGLITGSTFIGSEPNKLALSDDGQNLYVSIDGANAIRRFDTSTNTPGLQFSLGQDSFFGRYIVSDFAVAPANPNLLAVARNYAGVSPPEAGVAVFDNGVQRTNVGPGHTAGSDYLAFSASASKLYGTGQYSGLTTMTIDASGVTVSSTSSVGAGRIKFSNGLIFTSSGQVINPDTSSLLGTFFNANTTAFVPDTGNGRAYYLTSGPSGGTLTLKAFDINTFLLLGSLTINGVSGSPTSLVRWGPNGLAFRTTGNQLFIIQTALIPSAEPIPTPTPTPSPVPSPSPSPAAAFIKQIAVSTNDLVYSQSTQKLYASVPSSEGSTGNSVAEIDPSIGSVSSQVFVGSEPTQLALADDGATLYVGLNGAASVRSYNILSHTAGTQFSLGRDNFSGPYSASDIAVSPGNPSVIAVARQGGYSSDSGVAIFDGGTQRTKTASGGNSIVFASPTTLYGSSYNSLTTMTVDGTGVTVASTASFAPGASLVFGGNRLYGASGQVIDPSTGNLIGTFSGVGFGAIQAIDFANNRAFFLTSQNSTIQLVAYDLNTFLPLGFVNISGVSGAATSLLRWGSNGLAFRTSNRQVFLVETALVDPTVPVASPTPTPSPTPSPSPAYIPTFVRRVNLPANNIVYSDATQAIYASVPSSAGANGNSITKIIPETGVVGPSTFIGSEPNKLAISSDGQTLWAHLDGANSARRFDIVTQTPGLQFATSSQPPSDMEVVPGSPQSLAISKACCLGGVVIYDNGVQRPNVGDGGAGFYAVLPIEFGASPSVIYGYDSYSSGFELVKFLVDSNGVTVSSVTNNLLTGYINPFEFSNGLVYSGSGRVADPENQTLIGTFYGVGGASTMTVDAANHRVFYAYSSGSNIVIQAFDSNTFLLVGSITIPGISNLPVSLLRWGVNGLAFNTVSGFGSNEVSQVVILQTELVSNGAPIPTGLQFEVDKYFTFEGSPSLSVKVSRTGDVSGSASVNYATSDGTATAGSDYTAASGTINFGPGEISKLVSIPIINDNLFENGNETFTLTLSNPTGSAILTTPTTTTVTISDNDSKPSMFVSSTIRLAEGDSGTTNFSIPVTLSNPSVQSITVDYATSNVTATAGSDYTATSGTLTIPAGATSGTINVPVSGDTTIEPDETFSLTLSNPSNISFLSNGNETVTIANDDATLQLNNASFSVNEGAGFATVTATRIGDTSRVATVQYSTTDAAGLQACTLANGKASERCDYATAVGRVQFAIGETSKTFIVPIVDDALVEGDETFTVNLNGATGALLGTTNSATVTIVDNDASPASQNPVDGVTFFVTQQYIDFLGRLPDTIGLANWTATLGNCPSGGFGEFDNPDCDRVHVSAGFFLSEEFRVRGYWAYKFYEVGLDRRPSYAEFVPDMAQVGGPQSPQSEALSKQLYTDAFVQRQEFKNRYDALSNSAYVDALETNAEVNLSNKSALVDALNTNQKTRAQVLRELIELQTVDDKFFVRAFVVMQYFGYLRRDPDTIGYNNWVTTLTNDPANYRHMIFGFIYSDEYRHRFGP